MESKIIALMALGLMSTATFALTPSEHILIAPKCLMTNVSASYDVIGNNQRFLLISAGDKTVDVMAEAKVASLRNNCGGFVDVTNDYKTKHLNGKKEITRFINAKTAGTYAPEPRQYAIKYTEQTEKLIKTIDSDAIWNNLTTLTSYPDRYSRGDNGVKAAAWIKDAVEKMAKDAGRDDVTAYYVQTGSYIQPSVVVKVGNSTEAGVVIGGHMDTLNSSFELKPGADDDGSGTVTVLGVARTVLKSGMHFKRPIYFIWYSAEEMGLIGSSYVVKDFVKKKIPVDSVIQFDMTGYEHKNESTIWIMQDNVDPALTKFITELVKTYVKTPIGTTRCGYGCSDHASWHDAGFRSSFPFESQMNSDDPYIHTSNDKMEYISKDHITDFAKLGTAFAVELAEPLN